MCRELKRRNDEIALSSYKYSPYTRHMNTTSFQIFQHFCCLLGSVHMQCVKPIMGEHQREALIGVLVISLTALKSD